MADEARLTIVIQEPTAAPAAGPGAPRPSDDLPGWYPRYRDLRNRADMGQTLAPAERAELDDLGRRLTEFASQPPPPMPPATAAAAGAPTGAYQPPSAAPPGWTVPSSRPVSAAPPAATASSALPAYGAYAPPTPAPPNFGLPAPGVGIYQPPPPPPPTPPAAGGTGGLGPGFPGWDNLYRGVAGRDSFGGLTAQGLAATANAAVGERVATARAAKKRREGKAWRRQFGGWQEREAQTRDAFDRTVGTRPAWQQAIVGAGVGGAQAAAAGGSMLGGAASGALAAAGGPVGLAMAAVELKDAITNKAIEGVTALGDTAKKVAGNDGMGLFQGAVGKAATAVESIGVAGWAVAIPLKAAGAAAGAFKDAADAFSARGRELAGYNGNLAAATATADVRSLMADIREANAIGPDVARLIDSQSRADVAFRQLIEPLKQAIAKFLASGFERIADTLESLNTFFTEWGKSSDEYAKNVKEMLDRDEAFKRQVLEDRSGVYRDLKSLYEQAMENERRKAVQVGILQEWLDAANGLGPMNVVPGGGPAARGRGTPAEGEMGLPLFGR